MIGAFAAGAIGGALFALPKHAVNETHVHMPKQKNCTMESKFACFKRGYLGQHGSGICYSTC